MKKLFLAISIFISLNVFAQNDFFKVKEGSFHQIEGFLMMDKNDHYDDNDKPMALIKISTENISAQERRNITFNGNLETYFDVRIEPSEIYLYLSAQAATFIEIHHPDYGKTEFTLPYDLKDFCGYEMVLSYIPVVEPAPVKEANLIVKTNPSNVNIYVDDKYYGQTPNIINSLTAGTYNLRLAKEDCYTQTKTITLKEGQTLTIDENLRYVGKNISISTGKYGDDIYVDGNYLGISPLTEELPYGSHTVKAIRNSKEVSKTINVSKSGGDNDVVLSFNEINGHEYVDLGLPSGLKWATYNVGARSPEDYGDYYAWGETKTKSQYYGGNGCATDKYRYDMKDISGNTKFDVARLKWGSTWRMPTKAEFEELNSECTWTWTTKNGVNGYEVTGPNDNSIFLPAAGYCYDVRIFDKGSRGHYWSSTPASLGASAFQIGSNEHYVPGWKSRGEGRTIRPVTQ